ncbi:MAG: DNA replication and repair protein RecN [Candidatus Electronema aureum]|uniref:DNA repair protein RecN n=1 Tax=Candidatus Electronema aureum TaxID=2005002 RepID=A0A521G2M4_9BACT|nr:MAG: DNA replication and repair protein RecN [Candidatus Electronema aureum]
MLLELRINDLALISTLELDFSVVPTGLIVFTGETGAGKSIILQAVHLLTGGRASSLLVRSGCEQATIEASFDISKQPELAELLHQHGLDSSGDCILRRIVNGKGRSRFFINDRLATARLVADLTENLVNIAGQHDQQLLLRNSSHIDFLDGYGGLLEQRQQYTFLYDRRQQLLRRLRLVHEQEQHKEQKRDFLGFQLREIRQAGLSPGEDDALIKERDLLKSSTALVELVGKSCQLLREQVHGHLSVIRKNMEQAFALDPNLKELSARTSSACFEIEDLEGCLDAYLEAIPSDHGRMEQIAARLAQIRQLQRKYGTTIEEVLAFAERIEKELHVLDRIEQELAELELELHGIEAELRQQAAALSQERIEAGAKLSQAMQSELASLSFKQTLFEVSVQADAAILSSDGWDKVEFLFSANPGEPLKPLTEVVSGGELSRLMLAMKCLFARQDKVETVILDEIDAGIGGEAASAVARKIDELSGHHQVFCITHLPQIAAYGDAHFLVEKIADGSRTRTFIRSLLPEERAAELARMLGGDNPTEQTMALAREMLDGGTRQKR